MIIENKILNRVFDLKEVMSMTLDAVIIAVFTIVIYLLLAIIGQFF